MAQASIWRSLKLLGVVLKTYRQHDRESQMGWARVTEEGNEQDTTFVNLGLATSVRRRHGHHITSIIFEAGHQVMARETPDELLAQLYDDFSESLR